MERDSTSSHGRIQRLLVDPRVSGTVGLLGLLLGIFGVYAWWDSRSEPFLTGRVHSIRTILVSSEGTQTLQISANGKPIKGPVTAAQIAIWNDGKRPIKFDSVLEPIRVQTTPPVPILSVRVLRTTRELVKFNVDDSNRSEGMLTVRFRILEQGDGGLLQVTYVGDETVSFIGTGVLEGQRAFEVTEVRSRDDKEKNKGIAQTTIWGKILGIAVLLVLAFGTWGFLKFVVRATRFDIERAQEKIGRARYLAYLQAAGWLAFLCMPGGLLVFFWVAAYQIALLRSPPFPFQ